jgi:hypothetical protein
LNNDIESLRNEFDKFVAESCIADDGSCNTDNPEEESDDELPFFVDELLKKLLSPEHCGVNLSRIDLKRISDESGDSVAIQNRDRMLKAILRHRATKVEVQEIFDIIERYLNGRVLIYNEIIEAYPSSKATFESYLAKIETTKVMFKRIVRDFEDINPDSQPIDFDEALGGSNGR